VTDNNNVHEIFKQLHAMPETAFEEHRTSAFIAGELEKMGYQVTRGIAGTGVIGAMEGAEEGPALAVRADMDALPFEVDGMKVAIHACGHDANSSMSLAAAKVISKQGIKKGKMIFLYQPAEERGSGAKAMAESGMLPKIDYLLGMHLRDHQEAQVGQATPGVNFSGLTELRVTVTGKACHSSRPHQGINPIDAAITAITAVNAIRVDPKVCHTCKVTKFNTAGDAFNIIPDTAELAFDLRAQSGEVIRDLTEKAITAITNAVQALGATADIRVPLRFDTAEYDEGMIQTAKEAITDVLGSSLEQTFSPGSEDFHFFTNILGVKTAYIGLGGGIVNGLHHPEMSFDHKALEYGRDILVSFIHKRLG